MPAPPCSSSCGSRASLHCTLTLCRNCCRFSPLPCSMPSHQSATKAQHSPVLPLPIDPAPAQPQQPSLPPAQQPVPNSVPNPPAAPAQPDPPAAVHPAQDNAVVAAAQLHAAILHLTQALSNHAAYLVNASSVQVNAPAVRAAPPPLPVQAPAHPPQPMLPPVLPPPPPAAVAAPVPPGVQHPAPPSHLDQYPPPLGGSDVNQLLAAVRNSDQVSPPSSHSSSSVININDSSLTSGGDISFTHIDANNQRSSSTRSPLDESEPLSAFSGLPPVLRAPNPSLSDKLPRTAKDFRLMLFDWLNNDTAYQSSVPSYRAMTEYCVQTVEYAETVGLSPAIQYHRAAVAATQRQPPLWNPLLHGAIYPQAYSQFIVPNMFKPSSVSTRHAKGDKPYTKSSGVKRTYNPTDSSPSTDDCELHPGKGHTNAACKTQAAQKKKTKRETSPSAGNQ